MLAGFLSEAPPRTCSRGRAIRTRRACSVRFPTQPQSRVSSIKFPANRRTWRNYPRVVLLLRVATARKRFAIVSSRRLYNSTLTITRSAILPTKSIPNRTLLHERYRTSTDLNQRSDGPFSGWLADVQRLRSGSEGRRWSDARNSSARDTRFGRRIRLRQDHFGAGSAPSG